MRGGVLSPTLFSVEIASVMGGGVGMSECEVLASPGRSWDGEGTGIGIGIGIGTAIGDGVTD